MKLLIITAVKEFKNQIVKIILASGADVFSYFPTVGYKDISTLGFQENWFGSEVHENESLIFMAFATKEQVDSIFERVQDFNKSEEFSSKVHLATVNLERHKPYNK